jgi:hypothetical protein
LDRGGDRQLNYALHVIAITRARHDPATKAYLARKEAEGKTKKGALRCLKRHLAHHFHHLLSMPPQTPPRHPDSADVALVADAHSDRIVVNAAPAPMPCIG